MPITDEERQQREVFVDTLEEMKAYLERLAQGCEELSEAFHSADKGEPLAKLVQIIEGLSYCPKLFQAATVLLAIDINEDLGDNVTFASFSGELLQIFASLDQAAEGQDYSMLADLVEYDLPPIIQRAQELLITLQRRCTERVV